MRNILLILFYLSFPLGISITIQCQEETYNDYEIIEYGDGKFLLKPANNKNHPDFNFELHSSFQLTHTGKGSGNIITASIPRFNNLSYAIYNPPAIFKAQKGFQKQITSEQLIIICPNSNENVASDFISFSYNPQLGNFLTVINSNETNDVPPASATLTSYFYLPIVNSVTLESTQWLAVPTNLNIFQLSCMDIIGNNQFNDPGFHPEINGNSDVNIQGYCLNINDPVSPKGMAVEEEDFSLIHMSENEDSWKEDICQLFDDIVTGNIENAGQGQNTQEYAENIIYEIVTAIQALTANYFDNTAVIFSQHQYQSTIQQIIWMVMNHPDYTQDDFASSSIAILEDELFSLIENASPEVQQQINVDITTSWTEFQEILNSCEEDFPDPPVPSLDSIPNTFPIECQLITEVTSGVSMNGGIDLGSHAKKVGDKQELNFIFQENKPIPLTAVGKDIDLLIINCIPDPDCPETPSNRYENLTGRVKYEWTVTNGPGEFIVCSCKNGSNTATGDNVFLEVMIPKDSTWAEVEAQVRIVDDIAGQVLDAPVIRIVEIEAKRLEGTLDSVSYRILADPVILPTPVIWTDSPGTCKAVPPVWLGIDDIMNPVIFSNSMNADQSIIPGQTVSLNVSDVRDSDLCLLGCESKMCTGTGERPSYEDNIEYSWKIKYKASSEGKSSKSPVGFVVGIDTSSNSYKLENTDIGSQVIVHVERPKDDETIDGTIEVQVTAYNAGYGQVGDKPKSFKQEYEIKNRPVPSVFLTEVYEPEEEGVEEGIIHYDLYEWMSPGTVIEELPTDITLEINGNEIDGNVSFDAPSNASIKTIYKTQDREVEDEFDFMIPDDHGAQMINGLGSVNNLNCLCAGSLLFDVNSVVRFPINIKALEGYIDDLETACHKKVADSDVRAKRKKYADILKGHLEELKTFINRLINRNKKLSIAHETKIKDFEKFIEELDIDESTYNDIINSSKTGLSSTRVEIKNIQNQINNKGDLDQKLKELLEQKSENIQKQNAILLKYDKILNQKLTPFSTAEIDPIIKEKLYQDSSKETVENKIKKVENIIEKNKNGHVRTAAKNGLKEVYEEIDQYIIDSKEENKTPKELIAINEELDKKEKQFEKELKDLDEELKKFEEILTSLKKILELYKEIEKVEKEIEKLLALKKKLFLLHQKYANLNSKSISAQALLERIPALKKLAENELETTKKLLQEAKDEFALYKQEISKLTTLDTTLEGVYKKLIPGNTYGELTQYLRKKESTKALKNALQTVEYLGSDTYLRFNAADGGNIIASFMCGYISGLNPMETVEMVQYALYLASLYTWHEDLYDEEIESVLGLVKEAATAFTKASFAEQVAIIAAILGNIKGEIHLARVAKITGGAAAGKLSELNQQQRLKVLESRMAKAIKKLEDPNYPLVNKNSVMRRLFKRHYEMVDEIWELNTKSLHKHIDDLVTAKKIDSEAGKTLKEVLGPADLKAMSQDHLVEAAVIRVLKKIEYKYVQKQLDGDLPANYEPIVWQSFYSIRDLNKGLAGMIDNARDRIIFRHINAVLESPDILKLDVKATIGYTGSASKITPDARDWTAIAGDRDLLFLGPDAPVAMARFKRSIRKELGESWGRMLDTDVYMDSQFDTQSLVGLSKQKKIDAEKILNLHRKEMNQLANARLEKFKSGGNAKVIKEEKLNEMLFEIGYHYKKWLNKKSVADLEEYLKLNREYFFAQKDAYLTIGGRKTEVAYRTIWKKKYGIDKGEDIIKYIDAFENGKLGKYADMPLVTNAEGLENILDNRIQIYNKAKSIKTQNMLICHETAKYYERAIRSGVQIEGRFKLTEIKVGTKTAEDYRRLAMHIKEAKNIETTKGLIAEFYKYEIDLKKPNPEKLNILAMDFINDLDEVVTKVDTKIRNLVQE